MNFCLHSLTQNTIHPRLCLLPTFFPSGSSASYTELKVTNIEPNVDNKDPKFQWDNVEQPIALTTISVAAQQQGASHLHRS